MKRVIAICIMCIFLCLFNSCTTYENATFIENDSEHYLLYQDNKYYETSIFTVTKEYGIKNKNDIELGWYYSFPFSTQFYSESLESPVFIYTLGSVKSVYLRQDYEYETDTFVIKGSDKEFVFENMLSLSNDFFYDPFRIYPSQTDITFHSKQYPRLKIQLRLFFVNNIWYAGGDCSDALFVVSNEFLDMLDH